MKKRITLGIIAMLILTWLFYYFSPSFSFSGPVGGWETSKVKIEAKYGYDEQIKLAALQLGEMYQKVIDNPNDISILKELDKSRGCISGLLIERGIEESKALAPWSDIRSIVISTFEQQRRYIRFNANLSGSMLPDIEFNTAQCHFKIEK